MTESTVEEVETPPKDVKLKVVPGPIKNGVYTCIGPRGRKTIKVKTVTEGNLAGKRIVYVFTGKDNQNPFDYTGVAFLNTIEEEVEVQIEKEEQDEHGAVAITITTEKKTQSKDVLKIWKRKEGSELHRVVQAWLTILIKGIEGYTYELAVNCVRCNHLLTVPESILAGVGAVCAAAD